MDVNRWLAITQHIRKSLLLAVVVYMLSFLKLCVCWTRPVSSRTCGSHATINKHQRTHVGHEPAPVYMDRPADADTI